MLIIIDKRMPEEVKANLSTKGELLELSTSGITYDAISGHPDIFFCPTPAGLIVAPNTPEEFLKKLSEHNIAFICGDMPVGAKYPETAHFNALVTDEYVIHNPAITDPRIRSLAESLPDQPAPLIQVPCSQGYVRCNLIHLAGKQFITSDRGIEKALKKAGMEVFYISPVTIQLPGFKHGFWGGCCGVLDRQVFVAGNLDQLQEGRQLSGFVAASGFSITELYNGPLIDGGGILFVRS